MKIPFSKVAEGRGSDAQILQRLNLNTLCQELRGWVRWPIPEGCGVEQG